MKLAIPHLLLGFLVFTLSIIISTLFVTAEAGFLNIRVALLSRPLFVAKSPRPFLLPSRPIMKKPVDTHALISAAAKKHRVPAAFIKSIVAAESNFNCDAISRKGAIGLMQLMPRTAEEYGADPMIPEQNVDAGTRYLRVLMDRYSRHRNSLQRVIAAYNAGPGMVDRYRGVPPFRETRTYVGRVLSFLSRYEKGRG
jgi:soluble lytic murein transglycosylase-like protein